MEGRKPDVKNQKSVGKRRLSPGSGVHKENRSTLSAWQQASSAENNLELDRPDPRVSK